MSFSIEEKVNFLFKKNFGKPSTRNDLAFFQEPGINASSTIMNDRIWTKSGDIPSSAPSVLTSATTDDNGSFINVKMTLTAPGCGMGPAIAMDAEMKIRNIPSVKDVQVEIVWEPLWDRDMMSDEAKLQLGMM